jgi:hypothetical protein
VSCARRPCTKIERLSQICSHLMSKRVSKGCRAHCQGLRVAGIEGCRKSEYADLMAMTGYQDIVHVS